MNQNSDHFNSIPNFIVRPPSNQQQQQQQNEDIEMASISGLGGSVSSASDQGQGVQGAITAGAGFQQHQQQYNEPYSPDPSGFALSDLIMQLEDYAPTIPDAVANHFLHQAGFESTDPRISRLISLCAQKFISDIVNDSFTHCKLKGIPQPVGKTKVKDRKFVMTLDDLVPVLNDYGITIKKPPYYC